MDATDKPAVGLCARRLLAASLLLAAACEQRSGDQADSIEALARQQLGFIAFVGAGANDPLWPILKAGAQRYLEQGATLGIRFFAPASDSAQDQINLVETLQDPQMRGLCIQIVDVGALMPVLNRLYNQGTLIVSMIQPAPERLRVGHVGFDNEAVGWAVAQLTARTLHDGGSIMLLHAGQENPVASARLRTFDEEIATHPEISVLARLDCQGDPREARRLIRERSARYPRLSAWVALDDWPVRDLGHIESIIPPGCRFITFGGTPAQWPLIRKGICPGVVAANYYDLGHQAAQLCESAILRPSRFKSNYTAPLRTVGSTNLDEYTRDWTFWSTGQRVPDHQLQGLDAWPEGATTVPREGPPHMAPATLPGM